MKKFLVRGTPLKKSPLRASPRPALGLMAPLLPKKSFTTSLSVAVSGVMLSLLLKIIFFGWRVENVAHIFVKPVQMSQKLLIGLKKLTRVTDDENR